MTCPELEEFTHAQFLGESLALALWEDHDICTSTLWAGLGGRGFFQQHCVRGAPTGSPAGVGAQAPSFALNYPYRQEWFTQHSGFHQSIRTCLQWPSTTFTPSLSCTPFPPPWLVSPQQWSTSVFMSSFYSMNIPQVRGKHTLFVSAWLILLNTVMPSSIHFPPDDSVSHCG